MLAPAYTHKHRSSLLQFIAVVAYWKGHLPKKKTKTKRETIFKTKIESRLRLFVQLQTKINLALVHVCQQIGVPKLHELFALIPNDCNE